MKKNYIIAFASLALALIGCSKKEVVETPEGNTTVIEVACPDTKAVLAEDGLTVNWQVGDKIKVNDKNSVGLTAADITSPTSARFTFNDVLAAPYYAMFNATNGYQFKTGEEEEGGPHCRVNLDSPQTYAENSFDSHVATYWGVSDTPAISFNHAMAYIKVTPTTGSAPDAKISYIMLSSLSGNETLAGRFHLYFNDGHLSPVEGHANNRNYVVMNAASEEGVELGKPFIIAIPVQEYSAGISVRIASVDGKYMDRNLKAFTAVAGKIYPVETAFNPTGSAVPAVATAAEVTSSTVCFTWTFGVDVATDIAAAWTIQCSASSDFANATEYTIPEGSASSVWKNVTPKFCFGGLEQGKTYYFRVKTTEGAWSNTASATTTTYDKTVVSSAAKVGDVILAEDFAASAVQAEITAKAAGVKEDGTSFANYTGSFTVANASATYLPDGLKDWGFARGTGSANLYANQGHIKLGTGSAQSYLVTPALNAIPDNKMATLEVTLTLAVYPDDAARVKKFIVSSEKGTMGATNLFTCDAAFSNKVEADLEANNTVWATYTVELPNVVSGDRLMIAAANNAGNNRLLVSDVKAKVTALNSIAEGPIAKATEVSSSTVSFTWGYAAATAAEDCNRVYEFGLYKDEACSDLVVSYRTEAQTANTGCWKLRKPKFCFGALLPETTYYFKVKDVDAGVESEVVSSTTSAFTVVTMPASPAAAGDIILAEDFSEVFLGGEAVIGAAAACAANNEANVFVTLSGEFPVCVFNLDTDEKGLTNDEVKAATRLKDWSYAFNSGSSMYAHVGSVKLGTGSNNTWITSPVLAAIPEGKKADLEITVTLAAWSGAVTTAYVYAGNIADKASIFDAANVIKSSVLTTAVGAWNTYTVTLSGVDNTMRLIIGPDDDVTKTAKGKGRMVVNDVVVKMVSLN